MNIPSTKQREPVRFMVQTHCRAGKGFDRFPQVIDLHGYVNTTAIATASLSRGLLTVPLCAIIPIKLFRESFSGLVKIKLIKKKTESSLLSFLL
jgi:hypothetical protein